MTLNLASWSNNWWNKHKLCITYTDCINHFEDQTWFQFVFCTQLLTNTHQTPTGRGRTQKPSFKESIIEFPAEGWGGDTNTFCGRTRGMGTFWNNRNSYRLIILHALKGGGGGGALGRLCPRSKLLHYYTFHRGNGTPFTYQQYKRYHFHWVCSRYFEKPF